MSIQPQSPTQDARELIWQYLTNPGNGVSIFSDPPEPIELLPGPIVYNEGFQYTGGNVTVAKDPYPREEFGPKPKVIVGPTSGAQKILTLPPSWYQVDDTVTVKVVTRDWLGNDQGFNLSGNVARYNLVNSVKSIIMANQYLPDPAGVWSWMRITDPGQTGDKLTGQTAESPGSVPLYVTTLKVGLLRYTQSV